MSMLRQQVLETIRQERIRPVAAGYFWMRRIVSWTLVGVLLLFSVLATAFALHVVLEIDWEVFRYAEVSATRAILMSLPFLWLCLIVLFLFLSIVLWRRTGRGYRYSLGILLLIFPLLSTATGFLIEHSPLDEPIEKFFLGDFSQPESWHSLLPSAERQWSQPENGLLGGAVIEIDEEQETLKLEDRENKEWEVDFQDAAIETEVDLSPNTRVNMIGKETGPSEFEAVVIKQPKSHRETREQGSDAYQQPNKKRSEETTHQEPEDETVHQEDREEHEEDVDEREEERQEDHESEEPEEYEDEE